ncbi:hypothetical protein FSARC_9750 [Fusarium sarcochroum]|uniref:Rhodopsin domain-containing protein n=1 Tax=Fusarium sarcochroum TaxID=1208366 RepID=A0A8H4X5Y3_9HYPO|nr:hypothetical protein FSARC_9750 [Fusarium sarcochroum]
MPHVLLNFIASQAPLGAMQINMSIDGMAHASRDATSESPGYPHSTMQRSGFACMFFFCAAAFCTWSLRMYGRITARQLGWDDLLITISMALAIPETICAYIAMRAAYIGIHAWEIPQDADWVGAQRWNYVALLIYNPILALVKTSVLLFLLRLSGQKRSVRNSIIGLMIFNLCQMVALFICWVFQCTPIDFYWDKTPPKEGTCINEHAFLVSTASLTIMTDLLVLILPLWIFIGLKLPLRVRLAIIGVFTLGGVVTLLGILRLVWMIEKNKQLKTTNIVESDYTYDIRFAYAVIETNLAIITASAPALRPLFLKWFPNFFSALRSSGNRYQSGSRNRGNTGVRNSLRGTFPLKDMTKGRAAIRAQSPTNSEEEIMTYDGIMKTSDVTVHYGEAESGSQSQPGRSSNAQGGRGSQW